MSVEANSPSPPDGEEKAEWLADSLRQVEELRASVNASFDRIEQAIRETVLGPSQ